MEPPTLGGRWHVHQRHINIIAELELHTNSGLTNNMAIERVLNGGRPKNVEARIVQERIKLLLENQIIPELGVLFHSSVPGLYLFKYSNSNAMRENLH